MILFPYLCRGHRSPEDAMCEIK